VVPSWPSVPTTTGIAAVAVVTPRMPEMKARVWPVLPMPDGVRLVRDPWTADGDVEAAGRQATPSIKSNSDIVMPVVLFWSATTPPAVFW